MAVKCSIFDDREKRLVESNHRRAGNRDHWRRGRGNDRNLESSLIGFCLRRGSGSGVVTAAIITMVAMAIAGGTIIIWISAKSHLRWALRVGLHEPRLRARLRGDFVRLDPNHAAAVQVCNR